MLNFTLELPAGWGDITCELPGNPPPTVAKKRGVGALQFSQAELETGDPIALTASVAELEIALAEAVRTAIQTRDIEAVVIGGGPLAVAARTLAPQFQIPIIEPIPAAVRILLGIANR